MADWGGKRPGSGRKPGKTPAPRPVQVKPVDPASVVPPKDLTPEEREVWDQQAPHAMKSGGLAPASVLSFARYCRTVVLEKREAMSSGVGGSNHRGLLKQIHAYERDFMLIPCGKPLPEATEPKVEEEDEFFGGPIGVIGRRA